MKTKKLFIINENNEKLQGIRSCATDKKSIVIVCHGQGGDKDSYLVKDICQALYDSGINSFRFDFSGVGDSEGNYIDATTTKEISDIGHVIDHFCKLDFLVGLIGHSRGGMDSIIYAKNNSRIRFVVSIAGMAVTGGFLNRIFEHQKKAILEGKTFYWWEQKYGKRYPITPEKVKDLESYDPIESVKEIRCPILFLHGSLDTTIDKQQSVDMYNDARGPKEIKIYKKSGHNFENRIEAAEMIDDCCKFVKQNL